MPTLLSLFGPKQGLLLPLGATCVLGRSSDADVQLLDAKVSREHCRITCDGAGVFVEDLGSQNGTYLNGAPVTARAAATAGDEIAIGDSLFVVDPGQDVDVVAARYDDTVLHVAQAGPGPAAEPARSSETGAARVEKVGALAERLREANTEEDAARGVLAALVDAFAPERASVLASAPSGGLRPLCGHSAGAVVAVSQTVLDLARARGRGVLLDDAVGDRAFEGGRSVVRHAVRSVMAAPIKARSGALVGFLHVDRAGAGAFGGADLAALDAFAAVAGLSGVGGPRAETPLRPRPAATTNGSPIVGSSSGLRQALRLVEAAARVDSSVLITGESGTGKEELARALHAQGRRAAGPFIAVNCGAIVESLADSTLFGHAKGAFTGAAAAQLGLIEAADGGTLFLDEVGELPLALQVKLLRVLQERLVVRVGDTTPRRVDVRVVAATHRDLAAAVAGGAFREDLFYRLDVLRIAVPPLRERPEDLSPIAACLLARLAARLGCPCPALGASGHEALARWRWPGNVRELGNVLERILVLRAPGDGAPIDGDEVQAALGRPLRDERMSAAPAGGSLAEQVNALERREIEGAMRAARGVKAQAARALGISRPTLDKKLVDLGIDVWAEKS